MEIQLKELIKSNLVFSPDFIFVCQTLVSGLIEAAEVMQGLEGVERSRVMVQDVPEEGGPRSPTGDHQDVLRVFSGNRIAEIIVGSAVQRNLVRGQQCLGVLNRFRNVFRRFHLRDVDPAVSDLQSHPGLGQGRSVVHRVLDGVHGVPEGREGEERPLDRRKRPVEAGQLCDRLVHRLGLDPRDVLLLDVEDELLLVVDRSFALEDDLRFYIVVCC